MGTPRRLRPGPSGLGSDIKVFGTRSRSFVSPRESGSCRTRPQKPVRKKRNINPVEHRKELRCLTTPGTHKSRLTAESQYPQCTTRDRVVSRDTPYTGNGRRRGYGGCSGFPVSPYPFPGQVSPPRPVGLGVEPRRGRDSWGPLVQCMLFQEFQSPLLPRRSPRRPPYKVVSSFPSERRRETFRLSLWPYPTTGPLPPLGRGEGWGPTSGYNLTKSSAV